jgi:hypothetical protein
MERMLRSEEVVEWEDWIYLKCMGICTYNFCM